VERMEVGNWVKRCMSVTMGGRAPKVRPRKIWGEVLHNGLRVKGFNREAANDHAVWRAAIN